MAKPPNTHRLSWQTHDRGSGKRISAHMDYPSEAEARAAKEMKAMELPDAVLCVTAIVRKERGVKRESVGPGHKDWQGHRRVTA